MAYAYGTAYNIINLQGLLGLLLSDSGTALRYLEPLIRVANVPGRRSLRSIDISRLVMRCRLSNFQPLAAEHFRSVFPTRDFGTEVRKSRDPGIDI